MSDRPALPMIGPPPRRPGRLMRLALRLSRKDPAAWYERERDAYWRVWNEIRDEEIKGWERVHGRSWNGGSAT